MRAIDKKLWRELWRMRGQALAIALVIVSGVSIFIMSLSTLDSLYETREAYYRDHHFAHVFAPLKRAPLSLTQRIEEIPGVDKVETRVEDKTLYILLHSSLIYIFLLVIQQYA